MSTLKIVSSQPENVGTGNMHYESVMQFEQGTEGSDIQFFLMCHKLPIGTTVGFSCDKDGPEPKILLPPTKVTVAPDFAVGIKTYVPADFTGDIVYYADFSQQPPQDASIHLQAAYPVTS